MRNIRLQILFFLISLAALFYGCGGGDSFRISGEIDGIGTQNLNVVYYGDGAIRSLRTAVVDGKFMFDGASRDWTTVYIFSSRRQLIAFMIVRNGESVQAHIDINDKSKIKLRGNKPSELLSDWLSKHSLELDSDDSHAINVSVKDFVTANRNNVASTVILSNFFRTAENPALADSLLRIIDSKSRPGYLTEWWVNLLELSGDSTYFHFDPALEFITVTDSLQPAMGHNPKLWVYLPFDETRDNTIDSLINDRLKKIKKDTVGVDFIEIDRYVADTAQWKKSVRNDSLTWRRLWHPLNSLKLPVNDNELFMVADTSGNVLYHGSDIWEAIKTINVY